MRAYTEPCPFATLSDIAGKKVTVMGLGLNGGGEATVRFFARYGAVVTVTDMKTEEDLRPTLDSLRQDKPCAAAIEAGRITFVLGKHEISDFETADVVIKNPGVKYDGNKFLAAAKCVETDISLFLRFSKAPVVAVTGSKGKSSTVSAIHWGFCHAGFTSFLGGNITVSPLTFLEQTDETTPVVLELSSWQLADLRGRGLLRPKIALITKIVPDHQNWYGSMESYVADKKLIYADQAPTDYTLCTADDDWGRMFAAETGGTVVWYSAQSHAGERDWSGAHIVREADGTMRGYFGGTMIVDRVAVPGFHMMQNITNAGAALALWGVPPETIREVMSAFPGIEHRLEHFLEWNGIPVFNDSAATVPEAVLEAVRAFPANKTVLLTGGTDKGLNFAAAATACVEARSVYLLAGSGTEKLVPLLDAAGTAYHGPYPSLADMLAAVKADVAGMLETHPAGSGGTTDASGEQAGGSGFGPPAAIVFSPGATSFGMFKNEFDRGTQFKAAARALLAERSSTVTVLR